MTEPPPPLTQLPSPPGPSSEGTMIDPEQPSLPPPPPWWKFWRGRPEHVLARATVFLAIATILLVAIAAIQAYILATTDASTRTVGEAATSAAGTAKATLDPGSRSLGIFGSADTKQVIDFRGYS